LTLSNAHVIPSFFNTPSEPRIIIIIIIMLVIDLDCSDHNQIAATKSAVDKLNSLLKHTSKCPGNVIQVNNTHIKKPDIQTIGLCPFELTINYDDRRKPAIIVEAKCKSYLKSRCSTVHGAKCRTLKEEIVVTDLNKNINKTLERSIGCFSVSRTSQQISTMTPSYPRRRRRTSE
jgi:hypothetical protein